LTSTPYNPRADRKVRLARWSSAACANRSDVVGGVSCSTTSHPDHPVSARTARKASMSTEVVDEPAGRRPFRVHIDPSHDGGEVVSVVYDRIRTEFYRRIGIAELLPESPTH
jgi:hypothetical protein